MTLGQFSVRQFFVSTPVSLAVAYHSSARGIDSYIDWHNSAAKRVPFSSNSHLNNLILEPGALSHPAGREVRPIRIRKIDDAGVFQHAVEPCEVAFSLPSVSNLMADIDREEEMEPQHQSYVRILHTSYAFCSSVEIP
jgi:hypothetical protein